MDDYPYIRLCRAIIKQAIYDLREYERRKDTPVKHKSNTYIAIKSSESKAKQRGIYYCSAKRFLCWLVGKRAYKLILKEARRKKRGVIPV